jgi:hypothetical protein
MDAFSHFAILIAVPQPGETAMHRDQLAMAEALLARGFAADDILCLHDRLDRLLVLAALQAFSRRVAGWTAGSVFVHVSGHGFFTGDTLETARPGLLFAESDDHGDDGHLFCDDFFAALALPAGCRPCTFPPCACWATAICLFHFDQAHYLRNLAEEVL